MKLIDTKSYLDALTDLTEDGHTVSTAISGGSMLPFLAPNRDFAILKKPDKPLKKGDIILFKRADERYILHRIKYIKNEGYYIIGDSQNVAEGPVEENRIVAVVVAVKRKGKLITPENIVWKFYSTIWLRIIPLRRLILRIRAIFRNNT